jgi:hypothetical protein
VSPEKPGKKFWLTHAGLIGESKSLATERGAEAQGHQMEADGVHVMQSALQPFLFCDSFSLLASRDVRFQADTVGCLDSPCHLKVVAIPPLLESYIYLTRR